MWEACFVCTSSRFGGFWAEAWCRALANAQPSTGRLGWAVQIGNLLRGLFSYKSPTHQPGKLNTVQLRVTQRRANFSAGYKRDLALDDKSVSSTAVLDQQALPAGHPPPFEKGGRKLLFFFSANWVPRGRNQGHPPNQYVNWQRHHAARLSPASRHRAQPKASDLRENVKFRAPEAPFANWVRAQLGANWVQAQPATTFCGLPCWKARMLSSTICMQRRRACSGAQAMCGVTIQCGCSISGEPCTGGSSASTSMAA